MTERTIHERLDDPGAEARLEAEQQRRNRVLVIVLLAAVIGLMLLSHHLFNNYWDPSLSSQVISH